MLERRDTKGIASGGSGWLSVTEPGTLFSAVRVPRSSAGPDRESAER